MGIIQVGIGAAKSVLEDQWREYFYCPSMEANVLMTKGVNGRAKRGFYKKGSDNLITNGSIIAINEGQCMMIVEQGAIAEVCAVAGEFIYDTSTEPSIFYGDLSETVVKSFEQFMKRVSFGGDTGIDQRIYFFNTKEIMGNKYGTANPVPFRVVDQNIGLDIDIAIRCHGEYAYRIMDPVLFYKNIAGNVEGDFTRDRIDSQLKSELLTALQPAFAKISAMGVRYSAIPGHTMELANALNEVLSGSWGARYGIQICSIGVNSVKAPEEDEAMIKELQKNAVFRNPNMAAAHMVSAQADAMRSAAANTGTGPMMALAGMNMTAQTGGMHANDLFAMGQQQYQQQTQVHQQYQQQNQSQAQAQQMQYQQQNQQQVQAQQMQYQQQNQQQVQAQQMQHQQQNQQQVQAQQMQHQQQNQQQVQAQQSQYQSQKQQSAASGATWNCSCGHQGNAGKFCEECGSPRPEVKQDFWTCSCGTKNKGKFCMECGAKKPADAPLYKCDKCGWEPADPKNPPRFCPECGDSFGEEDRIKS